MPVCKVTGQKQSELSVTGRGCCYRDSNILSEERYFECDSTIFEYPNQYPPDSLFNLLLGLNPINLKGGNKMSLDCSFMEIRGCDQPGFTTVTTEQKQKGEMKIIKPFLKPVCRIIFFSAACLCAQYISENSNDDEFWFNLQLLSQFSCTALLDTLADIFLGLCTSQSLFSCFFSAQNSRYIVTFQSKSNIHTLIIYIWSHQHVSSAAECSTIFTC